MAFESLCNLGGNEFQKVAYLLEIEADLALGNSYIEQAQYTKARKVFEHLIEQGQSRAKVLNCLGHVYFCLGNLNDALKAFQQAIVLDPTLALAHQNMGYLYSDLETYDEAVPAFQNAIRLEPDNARPHYGLGLVYLLLGDEARAIDILQLASTLDPFYVGPRISLAIIYRRQGKETEYYKQVRFMKPFIARQKKYTRACYAALCGNVDETLNWLEEVVEQTPGYRWTIRHAIDFTAIRGHPRFLSLLGRLDFSQP